MAITAVLDIKGRAGKPYLGTDTEVTVGYIVYTDNASDGETAILASNCLPIRGQVFSENSYLAAQSLSLKREDSNPRMWRATITYKTDSIDKKEEEKKTFPNPADRPAEVEWDAVGYQRPAVNTAEDYTPPGETLVVKAGSPIVNSAWDLFDPPAEKTDYNWTANVTKYVTTVPTWLLNVPGCVNSSLYTIDGLPIAAGASRLTGLRIGRRQRENGYNYRELKMTIEFRRLREKRTDAEVLPGPWILELLDEGLNHRVLQSPSSTYQMSGPAANYQRCTDFNAKPTPLPLKLDGGGGVLLDPTPLTVVYRHFKIYRSTNFNLLPLT